MADGRGGSRFNFLFGGAVGSAIKVASTPRHPNALINDVSGGKSLLSSGEFWANRL